MIAKAIKGRGFRGVLEYDLGKEQARVIASNMNGNTARELACEFGELRKLRPKLGNAVLHVSLSAASGERLTDAQWAAIGQRYLTGMGLADNQFVATRHEDTEHEHIHLVVNRITFDGRVVSDSHDYRRQEAIMRDLEREYDLQAVPSSRETIRRAATQGEVEAGLRTGMASTRQRLQHLCDAASADCGSYTEYSARLEVAGVDLIPITQLRDVKLSGLVYRLDGVVMKGSDLGKGYSPAGLSKRGVSYEQVRDLAAVSRQRKREEDRQLDEADRHAAPDQDGERGAVGSYSRTLGTGDGNADRRDERDSRIGGCEEQGPEREDRAADRGIIKAMSDGDTRGSALGGSAGIIRSKYGVESLCDDAGDWSASSGDCERIVALAGTTANHRKPVGLQSSRFGLGARDRTYEAVQRQIDGMGAGRYEIELIDAQGRFAHRREWSHSQILDSVAWLKRMNARGHGIHIRPAGAHNLLLIDRMKAKELKELEAGGIWPAAKIQVGADRFQVWIKAAAKPISDTTRAQLAKRFKLPNDATPKFGLLAGYVHHRNPVDRDGGRFVLAHAVVDCGSERAAKSLELMADVREAMYRNTQEQVSARSRPYGHSR